MSLLVKITKSLIINVILVTTFSAFPIVSCLSSSTGLSSEKSKTASSKKKSKPKNKKKVAKVIKTARSYIGTNYKFGGFSRSGIDCSGLVCNAFKSINIELPRTSKEQGESGKTISIDNIQPGDLLFFADHKGSKKITHVGLVTEVKGNKNIKFIHSSTKLGVVEDNLFAEYYIPLFLKAVRIIN